MMHSNKRLRNIGLGIMKKGYWGTHFCQFYQNQDDLLEIIVPYFKAGLENNEFCMLVTSEPLKEGEAIAAMKKAIPRFNSYLRNGQIEVIPFSSFYLKGGAFSSKRVLNAWLAKLEKAKAKGFDGLRLSGNTFWLEKKDWKSFFDYEEVVNNVIGNKDIIALCTYSLKKCGIAEVLDVIANHQFAIIKRDNKWSIVETLDHRNSIKNLYDSESRYSFLFTNMINAFAYHKIVTDRSGKPVDYIFLEVNDSFERVTGIKKGMLIGRKVTEVIPGIEKEPADWIRKYGNVALGGKSIKFENYSSALKKWFSISAYCPKKGYFVSIFEDITYRKMAEEALLQSEAQFRRAIEYAPIPIIMHANDGEVLQVSHAWVDITGYGLKDIHSIGWWVEQAVHGEKVAEVKDYFSNLYRKGPSSMEFDIRTRTGEVRHWIFRASEPGMLSDGRSFFVGMALDITEKKINENNMRKALKEKETLLKEIHHRVKNNLQIVASIIRLRSRKFTDRKLLSVLLDAEKRLKTMALTHELIYNQGNLAEIDLKNYIVTLVNDLVNSYNKGIRLDTRIDVSAVQLPLDYAIPCGLIISELVSNTIKHAFPRKKQGLIRVSLHKAGRNAELTIADDGIGLPSGFNIKTADQLGLQLVSSFVDKLDGNLEIRNKKGVEFKIIFPMKND